MVELTGPEEERSDRARVVIVLRHPATYAEESEPKSGSEETRYDWICSRVVPIKIKPYT